MDNLVMLVQQARDKQNSIAQRHEAFGELVHSFQEAAFTWALNILEDSHQAQDTVQEAFVAAYHGLDKLRRPEAFAGWLRRIVTNQAYRQMRGKQVVTVAATPDLTDMNNNPATAVEQLELRDNVITAIQALPEAQQVVTKLFYFNGYSQKEIARVLELPVTTVKKRLQYARQHLKTVLALVAESVYGQPQPRPIPIPIRTVPPSYRRRNR